MIVIYGTYLYGGGDVFLQRYRPGKSLGNRVRGIALENSMICDFLIILRIDAAHIIGLYP